MRRPVYPLIFVPVFVGLAGCGDDGGGRDTATSVAPTTLGSASSSSGGDTVPTTGGSSGSGSGVTTGVSGESVSGSSSGGSSGGSSSGDVSSSSSGSSTGAVSVSSSGTMGDTSTGTTAACVCTPGEVDGCDGAAQNKCAADCLGFEPAPCPPAQKCMDGVCMALFCDPGVKVCEGEGAYKQCNGDGGAYDAPVNCLDSESCDGGACVSLCAQAEATPSSVGCSFFANRMDNYDNSKPDSMIVGNTSKSKTATAGDRKSTRLNSSH